MHIFLSWIAGFFKSPFGFLLSLMDEHKGIRRGLVIWAAMQTQYVIHMVFEHMDKLNAFVITMTSLVVVPLVGLVVYYVNLRSADDGDSSADAEKAARQQ